MKYKIFIVITLIMHSTYSMERSRVNPAVLETFFSSLIEYPEVMNQLEIDDAQRNAFLRDIILYPEILIRANEKQFLKGAATGNLFSLKKTIADKVNIEVTDSENGSTALILAAANNHREIVELLLTLGANINTKNKHDKTALDLAVEKKLLAMAKLLLEHKATISQSLTNDLAKLLDVQNTQCDILRNTILGKTSIVTNVLSLKRATYSDINAQDKLGMSALMWAGARGNSEIVSALLEYSKSNADATLFNKNQETALSLATAHGHSDIAKKISTYLRKERKKLFDALADVNITKSCGAKIIMHYIYDGHLKQCANCKERNAIDRCEKCLNVYYCSRDCQRNNWKLHKLECKEKEQEQTDTSTTAQAARGGRQGIIRLLINAGANSSALANSTENNK